MTDVPAGATASWTGRGLRLLGWIALGVAPLVVRVACEANGELDAAAAAREVGDGDGEVLHLGRALRWRLPLATHDERAIARLLEIGEQAAGLDPALSLAAYREIRSALIGSRGLDVPHADVLADVDARIAAAMADGDAAAEAARRAELEREPGRSRLGPALAAGGWIAWVWATARFVRRGVDARGRLVPGVGTRTGLLALALLVAWVIAWRFA
jgi:hypothetical protein